MKRIFLLLVCLLLVAGCLLSLTACNSKTEADTDAKESASETDTGETKTKNWENYLSGNIAGDYDFQEERAIVEQGDSAYLLDPNFAVTPENFADCMVSYFHVPTLYFQSCLDDTAHKVTPGMSFRPRFEDVLQLHPGSIGKLNPDAYRTDYTPEYCFQNAIGRIVLYSCTDSMNYTYLAFYRNTGSTQAVSYFYIDGHKTTPELYKIGKYVEQLASEAHCIWDDIPAIKNSDAAYLLDEDLKLTEENFYDCLCDYLTAPTMLYFESCFDETRRIQDPEKTKAFAEIFRDLPLIPVAKEEPVHAGRDQYGFMSVIGSLIFYEYDGSTYICLSLSGDYAKFRVEGDFISTVNSIGESLRDSSKIIFPFELAENFE